MVNWKQDLPILIGGLIGLVLGCLINYLLHGHI